MTEKEFILRCRDDFQFYSQHCLKIVNKPGKLVPFVLNKQQLAIHDIIQKQLHDTGKVRVIILKSRRLGISTYAAGRFTWKSQFQQHQRAGVITHLADSTSALFTIYKRMHTHLPALMKPKLQKSNAKELILDALDSSIKVSTAGSAQGGRGDTLQRGHLSECAFFPNDREIAAGYMQSISDTDGSEIIIESTSNNIGNFFYDTWVDAEQGKSEFICVFLPWMTDPDCYKKPPKDFELSDDEKEVAELLQLSDGQSYWRRLKIQTIGPEKFRMEFPASVAEAFRSSEGNEYISPNSVLAARKRNLEENLQLPLVLGVDVARYGSDRTCIVWRRGRKVIKYKMLSKMSGAEIADYLVPILNQDKPMRVYIDGTGGFGGAVVDCLKIMGYDSTEVNFSSAPQDKDDYFNKRAEMYARLKDWLETGDIPDEDVLEQDLTSFSFNHRNNKLLLEDKASVKKRLKRSPDTGDAIALTFSEELGPNINAAVSNANWSKLQNRDAIYNW